MLKIAPSLLSADFSRLADEIAEVEAAGADLLHLDVMDGHYVPNITFGPPVVKSVDGCTKLPLDVHLMITDPVRYAPEFVRAGADLISFHAEVVRDASEVVDGIVELGARPAIALNPDTGLMKVRPVLERLEMVLVMSVFPGFGGQRFIAEVLDKVRELRDAGYTGDVEVDGGVDVDTAPAAVEAGANVLVAGSAIFGRSDRRAAVAAIREAATRAAGAGRS